MVCECYLCLSNFEARPANFWRAFYHNSIVADVISSQVHLFTFSFTMKRQKTKSRMETVTGKSKFRSKQIFNMQATGNQISYLNFPTVSISLRKLVLLNWPTFMSGDGKLQKAVFVFSFRSKGFLKSISDMFREALTIKPFRVQRIERRPLIS